MIQQERVIEASDHPQSWGMPFLENVSQPIPPNPKKARIIIIIDINISIREPPGQSMYITSCVIIISIVSCTNRRTAGYHIQ